MNSGSLSDIKINVQSVDQETGNLQSILAEIEFALAQLLEQKKTHCIDLRAMPWTPGEEAKLEHFLGQGEIYVELNALGKSIFAETAYSGIWMVSHYNDENEIIGKLVEVTYLPDMIYSQTEDIRNSLERLKNKENI